MGTRTGRPCQPHLRAGSCWEPQVGLPPSIPAPSAPSRQRLGLCLRPRQPSWVPGGWLPRGQECALPESHGDRLTPAPENTGRLQGRRTGRDWGS